MDRTEWFLGLITFLLAVLTSGTVGGGVPEVAVILVLVTIAAIPLYMLIHIINIYILRDFSFFDALFSTE